MLKKEREGVVMKKTSAMSWAVLIAGVMVFAGAARAGLIAHYEFEETSLTHEGSGVYGVVEDSTGNQADAKYVLTAQDDAYIAGVINQTGPGNGDARAYHFDRENTYGVNTYETNLIPATGDFTVMVSFKTTYDSTGQQHDLVSCNNNQAGRASLMVINNTLLWFHNGGVTLEDTTLVNDGEWHVAGIARKGDQFHLYLDGEVVDTGTSSAALSQAENWRIGRRPMSTATSPFDGEISDLKIYDHYALPVLMAHYEFNETQLTYASAFNWSGVQESTGLVGADGSYWGYDNSAGQSNTLHGSMLDQPGPGTDGDDKAFVFEDIDTSGVSTYSWNLIPSNTDFTVLVSFKTTDGQSGDQGHIFSNNRGQAGRANLHVSNDKLCWFHDGLSAQLESAQTVSDGAWHVAGIGRTGDVWNLYLDGYVVAYATSAKEIGYVEDVGGSICYWMIGRDRVGPQNEFVGSVSDVKVYNRYIFPREAHLLAHYELEETQLTWNGSMWTGIEDSMGSVGVDGAFWGFGLLESNALHTAYINQPGPGKGDQRAYKFEKTTDDGIATYATDTVPTNSDFTIAVWFKTEDSSSSQLHMFSNNNSQNGRAGLYVQYGNLRWWHQNIAGGELVSGATVSDGKWHLGGVTREGDDWKLFLDGQVVASTTSSDSIGYLANAGTYYYYWCIGRARGGNYYDGYISDVKVYNISFIPEMPPPYGTFIILR
jgi:hypothetical protein